MSEQMARPMVYAGLLHASSSSDPARGALLVKMRERLTIISKHLIFFDLEWLAVEDAAAARLLADKAAHYKNTTSRTAASSRARTT